MIDAAAFAKELKLKTLVPSSKKEMDINQTDITRPGIQFAGYWEHFAFERIQVIGMVEMSYLEGLISAARRVVLHKFFTYDIPCVVITRGMMPPPELVEEAKAADVPVYQTDSVTTAFDYRLVNYLNRALAPRITRHGVLVEVYGQGVLLTGESGVGKSEAALELIKRGHQLVADDVVDIRRVSEQRIIGECPAMVRHFMEIRGIGIIDIRAMYGIGAVAQNMPIDLVMHLEHWQEGKAYDRLGLKDEYTTILGVRVPHLTTPVRPGRNMAIIIEVAARNLGLKKLGYNAASELDRRLNEQLKQQTTGYED